MGRTLTNFHLATALGLGAAMGWWLRGTEPAPILGEQGPATVASALLPASHSEAARSDGPNLEVPGAVAMPRSPLPPPSSSTLHSAAADDAGGDFFVISGSVQDEWGRPLRESRIILTASDEVQLLQPEGVDGSFRFGELATGDYKLSIRNQDYYGLEKTLVLDGAPREISQRFVLRPSQRLEVRVVTPEGTPFVLSWKELRKLVEAQSREATITFEIRRALSAWPRETQPARLALVEGGGKGGPGRFENDHRGREGWRADVIGFVVLDRPPPVYVSLFRGWIHIDSLLVRAGDTEVTFVVDPAGLAAQFGEVRLRLIDDFSGEPVVGRVKLKHVSSSGGTWNSDPDGSFQYAPAAPGEYSLDVQSTEHAGLHRTLHVALGEFLDLGTLRLHPVRPLRGRVVDPEGVGVPGFVLQYASFSGQVPDRKNLPRATRQRTDEEGRFELGGLPPGPVLLLGRLAARDDRERTALRIAALTLDTSEPFPEELVLQAAEPTEVELYPAEGAASHSYWIKDGSGIIIEKGTISTRAEALWLLPGDYLLVLADEQGIEQHVAFHVGSRWIQVRLP